MRSLVLAIGLATLAGCASQVTGNEAYVTVTNVWNDSEALPAAEAHCAGYGKVAKFDQMIEHRATFECVDPE